jgi:hypothetical protein
MRQAVFILPNIAKKERNMKMNNDELMCKALRNAVKISVEKKAGSDGKIETRIEGSVIGVMATSEVLVERIAKEISECGYNALVMWSAQIMRALTEELSKHEERGNTDGKKE